MASSLTQPADLGSQLMSGLSQQLSGQNPNTLVSDAASALNSVVSGVVSGGQSSGQTGQLLSTAQQVIGQIPGISSLQSIGNQALSSALNANVPQLLESILTGLCGLHPHPLPKLLTIFSMHSNMHDSRQIDWGGPILI